MPEATSFPLEDFSAAWADLVAAASPGVVAVQRARSRTSGLAWRATLIVTADEALADKGEIVVTSTDGQTRKANIVGRDPSTDIALLRVEGAPLEAIRFVAEPLRPGAWALALGAGPRVHAGIVATVGPAWQSMRGGAIDARIELDLRFRRESEGGLALDAGGRAFGMVVYGPRRRTLVIPAATIDRVAGRLERDGRIPRGYLGLGLQPVRIEGTGSIGAMIISLDRNGPGVAAGLHQGDVIVRWNGQAVTGVGGLLRALGPDSVGCSVAFTIRRGGDLHDLSLTVAERQSC
jgi:S1-C subfamily serine protease